MKHPLRLIILLAAFMFVACVKENGDIFGSGSGSKNVISFTIGNAGRDTKAAVSSESCDIQVASYALDEIEGEQLSLVETVSSIESLYGGEVDETKGAPVYTENFDDLYGTRVYATAFEPKTGDATEYTAKDVWGSYLENGGTVNFTLDRSNAHTYYYDYSKGQKVNLAWPEGGELLYFIQAPYDVTSTLNPVFYSDGTIQFDYADPAYKEGKSIENAAAKQSDILFTSKLVKNNTNNILMYHALTAVKFKVGNVDMGDVETKITKVTFKSIKADGHCTITPNYADANTSAGRNPSNKTGKSDTKSSECSIWDLTKSTLVVDYSQTFSGVVNYSNGDGGNSNFGSSFYDDKTNLNNLGKADGSEIMLMIPQSLKGVEVEVAFTIKSGDEENKYTRTVRMNDDAVWKAGELHTYTLTVNKVDVEITDQMVDKKVKKNVVTKNTGNVTAYLRATYALAWYYEATCVAPYENNGEIKDPADTISDDGNSWIKGSDGFYYYTGPVLPGKATEVPLFDKFTAPAVSGKGPFPGSHLEMNILLQGVQYDEDKKKVAEAWGDVYTVGEDGKPTEKKIVDMLSKNIEGIKDNE